jgi:hypothetical protein
MYRQHFSCSQGQIICGTMHGSVSHGRQVQVQAKVFHPARNISYVHMIERARCQHATRYTLLKRWLQMNHDCSKSEKMNCHWICISCTTDDVPCLTAVRQQCSIDIALCMYPLHSSLPACQQQKKVPYDIWLLLRPQAIKRSLKVR